MPTPAVPNTMAAVHLTGHGGPDKLEYRTDVPVPSPRPGEVLIAVSAAGINNTDINTRLGWYSSSVTGSTAASASPSTSGGRDGDGSWSGKALTFPRIQGADVCGRIVAVGAGVSPSRVGQRVLVRTMMRHYVRDQPWGCWTFGSECDGGFAQFCSRRMMRRLPSSVTGVTPSWLRFPALTRRLKTCSTALMSGMESECSLLELVEGSDSQPSS